MRLPSPPGSPHLATLARWASDLGFESIPADVLRAARLELIDMAAAVHASVGGPDVAAVCSGIGALASSGRATVLATGERLGPCEAAYINAAHSMAHDFDDIVWMGHTGHSAVFAALAVAEHEGKSLREMLLAVVVANELAGRLGASSILGPLNGQMWTFLHLVGSAAATAKLLGLDAERTTHALAIALAQPNFALQPGFLVPTSKLLAASTPLVAGIHAAYLARAGITGFAALLEDPRGFWSRFSFLPLPEMLGGLGETWVLRTLAVKTYPGCHYFQTALTAIERIVARTGPLTLDRVRRIRIDTTKLACEATRFASEYVGAAGGITPVSVNFDLALSAALLLHEGELGVQQLRPERLAACEPALRGWLQQIEVRHDPTLSAKVVGSLRSVGVGRAALRSLRLADVARLPGRYAAEYRSRLVSLGEAARFVSSLALAGPKRRPSQRAAPRALGLLFPNRVTIELTEGRIEVEQVDLPVGALAAPDVERELEKKLANAASRAMGPGGTTRAFSAALGGDSLPELVSLFAASPGSR